MIGKILIHEQHYFSEGNIPKPFLENICVQIGSDSHFDFFLFVSVENQLKKLEIFQNKIMQKKISYRIFCGMFSLFFIAICDAI